MSVLKDLMALIDNRKANPPERSYTARLLRGGVGEIGGRIRAEASEVVEAAREGPAGRDHVIHEVAELFYYVLVMLGHLGIRLDDIDAELARRFGVSGLDEKAARDP